jgi:hypothetical protein
MMREVGNALPTSMIHLQKNKGNLTIRRPKSIGSTKNGYFGGECLHAILLEFELVLLGRGNLFYMEFSIVADSRNVNRRLLLQGYWA